MKVSYRWLNDYINIEHLGIEELTRIMTELGLEVEGYEETCSIPGGLKGIVVGEVVECIQHPNADRLKLTQVNVGADTPLQIVCGAPNVDQGQKVPVATIGTRLYPAEGDPFEIKKGKLRGEVSEGMICAEDEMGLGNSHEGILVLPESYEVGANLSNYIEIEQDFIIDVDLTPNRADATNHRGIAEDIRAYLKFHNLLKSDISYPQATSISPVSDTLELTVEVNEPELAPRYHGIVLDNVKVESSPDWLQKKLKAIGISPKNNVVDFTNYILHDMGQPLHAFDYDQIAEHKIIVEKLPAETKFTLLDESEIQLKGNELMICDGKHQPLCMAGVYGGLHSGVTAQTTRIFIESAFFDAQTIRKASMQHNLRTDAAKVYEKGADPKHVDEALDRIVDFLVKEAGAKIASTPFQHDQKTFEPKIIQLTFDKVNQYLGKELSPSSMREILEAQFMEVVEETDKGFQVKVPTNKPEVLREVDLIEEIIRIYGIDEIEVPDAFQFALQPPKFPSNHELKQKVANELVGMGFLEAMSLSIVPGEYYEKQEWSGELVYIENSSNQSLNAMRPDMVITALQNTAHNHKRRLLDCRFFEFGSIYWKAESNFEEQQALCISLSGQNQPMNWIDQKTRDLGYYDIKAVVETVLNTLGIDIHQKRLIKGDFNFQYGFEYHSKKQVVVKFGKVKTHLAKYWDIKSDVFVAQFNWDYIYQLAQSQEVTYQEINKYPHVERDLALIIEKSMSYEDLEKAIYQAGKGLVTAVNLFDYYTHDELEEQGLKSYAVRLRLESFKKTLSDKEIEKSMQKIIKSLEKRFNARLR